MFAISFMPYRRKLESTFLVFVALFALCKAYLQPPFLASITLDYLRNTYSFCAAIVLIRIFLVQTLRPGREVKENNIYFLCVLSPNVVAR